MAKIDSGIVRDWLGSRREELNARFRVAQKRYPRLKGEAVLKWTAELLPPLGAKMEVGTDALLDSVYDLIILHCARGLLGDPQTPSSEERPLVQLIRRGFPAMLPLLRARPRALPGSLSNAVENLGARGGEFASAIVEVSKSLQDPDALLDAGAILAWRLGEARLRLAALSAAAAGRLPADAVLNSLGVPDWPEKAAPLLAAGLVADSWRAPARQFSPETLKSIPKATKAQLAALSAKITGSPGAPLQYWAPSACVGNFAGFDGHFEELPQLLDSGTHGNRHRFWVRCCARNFRIDADVFGWVCKSDPSVDFPVMTSTPKKSLWQSMGLTKGANPGVQPDGTFEHNGESLRIRALEGTTSYFDGASGDVLFFVLADSFRIRILAPLRPPI